MLKKEINIWEGLRKKPVMLVPRNVCWFCCRLLLSLRLYLGLSIRNDVIFNKFVFFFLLL